MSSNLAAHRSSTSASWRRKASSFSVSSTGTTTSGIGASLWISATAKVLPNSWGDPTWTPTSSPRGWGGGGGATRPTPNSSNSASPSSSSSCPSCTTSWCARGSESPPPRPRRDDWLSEESSGRGMDCAQRSVRRPVPLALRRCSMSPMMRFSCSASHALENRRGSGLGAPSAPAASGLHGSSPPMRSRIASISSKSRMLRDCARSPGALGATPFSNFFASSDTERRRFGRRRAPCKGMLSETVCRLV
mmetsp:Transcript_7300/g.21021  ORF Transcript_7300/g.21021 Transcript_7300/m.21021 type:complete len:248 (-) Transcript_7300:747-1490(-)